MNRILMLVGAFVLAAVMTSAALAEEKDKFTTKAFMKKFHHPKEGDLAKLKGLIKDKDWEEATKISKSYHEGAEKLLKVTPKKGEKEDWEKIATTFSKSTKTLADACEAKEAKKANGAIGAITKTCGQCHSKHK